MVQVKEHTYLKVLVRFHIFTFYSHCRVKKGNTSRLSSPLADLFLLLSYSSPSPLPYLMQICTYSEPRIRISFSRHETAEWKIL